MKALSTNHCIPFFRPDFLTLFALLIISAGCTAKVSRVEHAGSFPDHLTEKTINTLPDKPVTLNECIDIALANNLDLQALEIQKRLAALDSKSAFGNFLPYIELRFSFSARIPLSSLSNIMTRSAIA